MFMSCKTTIAAPTFDVIKLTLPAVDEFFPPVNSDTLPSVLGVAGQSLPSEK